MKRVGVVLGNNGVGAVLGHSLFPGHLAISTLQVVQKCKCNYSETI